MRASRPQLQFPAILYSIFTNGRPTLGLMGWPASIFADRRTVSATYAPQFSTMAQAMAFSMSETKLFARDKLTVSS